MNRVAGIVLAVVGVIVAGLSLMKVLPGVTQTGVALFVLGGLITGLSFVKRPDDEGTERISTPGTLANMFFSPSEVFQNLRRHPRWLIAALIMAVLSATYTNLFLERLGPERVANFAIDKTLEMPMIKDNEQARQNVEASRAKALADIKSPVVRAGQAVTGFATGVFGYAFLAAVFLIFALAMGGRINYLQALSVAVYAAFPVNVVRFLLNTLLLYLKDSADIHPILGQQSLIQDSLNFLVLSSEHPVIFTILGTFSLLMFYWVWQNATGLKNGGEKISGTIAWTAALSIFALVLLFGVIAAFLFPSFIS